MTDLAALHSAAMAKDQQPFAADRLGGYRLPPGPTVADLGGGDGGLLTEMLAGEPDRRGILLELPDVAAKAEQALRSEGLADRIEVIRGDFFEAVPAADIYLMSVVLCGWNDSEAGRILSNIAATAHDGARLVLKEILVPDGLPHSTKVTDDVKLALTGGHQRSEDEWHTLLARHGFQLDRITPAGAPFCFIEATLTNAAAEEPEQSRQMSCLVW
ncbi:methyltransferase [Actinoplanes solisilvae]|uniref:methyltransferase n=1 Tax=Actinoplanes solisilvae TaxID=2486853 RepID=UPI000FDC3182|nr:methyltransferase [Actinoplanes solisilvae]